MEAVALTNPGSKPVSATAIQALVKRAKARMVALRWTSPKHFQLIWGPQSRFQIPPRHWQGHVTTAGLPCRFYLPPIILFAGLSVRKKAFFKQLPTIASLGIVGTYIAFALIAVLMFAISKAVAGITLAVRPP